MAAALAVAAALAASPARAHVVYGTATLRGLVLESDLVAHVRIVDPGAEVALTEPVVVAEPLEVFKGAHAEGLLRFVQHGHGVPVYQKGDEVALFLQRIARSRELAAWKGPVEWVSIQEGAALALGGESGADAAAALRSYAAIEALPEAARPPALRRTTVDLLASPHAALASSAVRDLALAGDALPIGREDLPRLEPIVAGGAAPIGVRIALLSELERRRLAPGPPRWVRLVRETSGPDRLAVVRAAGAHPSRELTSELVALLAGDDELLVCAAAVALGAPANDAAVEPLAALLASGSARVRMAALRGLGGVGTGAARAALEVAAGSHADPATRRRARAEAQRLRGPVQPGAEGPPRAGAAGTKPAPAETAPPAGR